jgi:uncharacterized protein
VPTYTTNEILCMSGENTTKTRLLSFLSYLLSLTMLQQRLFVLLACGILHLPTWAQQTAFEKSLFWEVSGKGKTKMYILGTNHFYPNDFAKNSPAIQNALKKAKIVVGEMVIDTNQMRMAMKMLKYMYMPNNSLKKLLSPEDYQTLKKYFKENMKGMGTNGMSIEMMDNMKPLIIQQMLIANKYMEVLNKKNGESKTPLNPTMGMGVMGEGLDGYVQLEAIRQKKEVAGLETLEDQAEALFNMYPLEKQAQMLMEAVRNEKSGSDEELTNLHEIYEAQDIDKLFEVATQNMTTTEMDALLTNRNNKWMPQLEKMLAGKKHVFVAVGAGHLAGKIGILTQLRAKGYIIKPVAIQLK